MNHEVYGEDQEVAGGDWMKKKGEWVLNIFEDFPDVEAGEVIEMIAELGSGAVRIERIISGGHASAEGFWYEQEEDEWVMLIRGQARLVIESREEALEMKAGDHVELPARLRHRVEFVSNDAIWVAVKTMNNV